MSWGIDARKIKSETAVPESRETCETFPTFVKWLVVNLVVLILLLAVAGLIVLHRNCPPSSIVSSTRML